jgi:c-di-GMP-binding flagellar brake protein YcgR
MQEEMNQEYLLNTPEDVYGALRKVVLLGSPVVVKVDGDDSEYRSAITSSSFKTRSFFMDKVTPLHGNDLIRSGKRFSIECDSQGVHIEFRMTGRLRYQPESEQYRGEFPEEVLYLQRRTAYRVMVPPAHQILVTLKIDDNDEEGIEGRLLDMSSSGFKARFDGDIKQTLDCSLEARHVFHDDEVSTLCGFSFTTLSPQGQRYIDRLITEFQWEERRLKEQQKSELDNI